MSGGMIALVLVALGLVALGLQVLSRHMQRSSVDARRADPLIDVSRTKSANVRPAELHQLIDIVSNSLISEASRRSELQPILDSLGAGAPKTVKAGGRLRTRTKSHRTHQIEAAIAELEARWLSADADDRSPSAGQPPARLDR
jgi:hypothetical protein